MTLSLEFSPSGSIYFTMENPLFYPHAGDLSTNKSMENDPWNLPDSEAVKGR